MLRMQDPICLFFFCDQNVQQKQYSWKLHSESCL